MRLVRAGSKKDIDQRRGGRKKGNILWLVLSNFREYSPIYV
jgi:hypothetical protein